MVRRLVWMLPLLVSLPAAGLAQAQVQLSCAGTLVGARGSAERKRTTASLRFSLAQLQGHLSAVRSSLQTLQVRELQVSSPSTWQRPASRTGPERVLASLQVSGQLAPASLQALVRVVGSLPGVRLAPVSTEADGPGDRAARATLLRAAYQDALSQGQTSSAVGDGSGGGPV